MAIKKYKTLQGIEEEKIKRKNSVLLKRESIYEKRLKELKRASIGLECIQLKSTFKRHEHKFNPIANDTQNQSKCTICGLVILHASF